MHIMRERNLPRQNQMIQTGHQSWPSIILTHNRSEIAAIYKLISYNVFYSSRSRENVRKSCILINISNLGIRLGLKYSCLILHFVGLCQVQQITTVMSFSKCVSKA